MVTFLIRHVNMASNKIHLVKINYSCINEIIG